MDRQQQGRYFRLAAPGKRLFRLSFVAVAIWRDATRHRNRCHSLEPAFFELRESYDRNAYRLMYVLKLKQAIYVLHVFMKKSRSGIGLPKPDADVIDVRLRRARILDAEDGTNG